MLPRRRDEVRQTIEKLKADERPQHVAHVDRRQLRLRSGGKRKPARLRRFDKRMRRQCTGGPGRSVPGDRDRQPQTAKVEAVPLVVVVSEPLGGHLRHTVERGGPLGRVVRQHCGQWSAERRHAACEENGRLAVGERRFEEAERAVHVLVPSPAALPLTAPGEQRRQVDHGGRLMPLKHTFDRVGIEQVAPLVHGTRCWRPDRPGGDVEQHDPVEPFGQRPGELVGEIAGAAGDEAGWHGVPNWSRIDP